MATAVKMAVPTNTATMEASRAMVEGADITKLRICYTRELLRDTRRDMATVERRLEESQAQVSGATRSWKEKGRTAGSANINLTRSTKNRGSG